MMRAIFTLLALMLAAMPVASRAEVVVTFWSHMRDQNYPHAFLTMQGRVDGTGEMVDTNIGFTAVSASPMVLIGPVAGRMETVSAGYMARPATRPHFALRLDDAQFARLRAMIAQWTAHAQPSYSLSRRNCVHFVMEAAALLGLTVNRGSDNFRKPRDFLNEIMVLNPQLAPLAGGVAPVR
ncbi:MAG: hypothetical protein ACKOUM_05570 [Sphingopyxis sp.]